jgi:predicted HTH transcriptional regulator
MRVTAMTSRDVWHLIEEGEGFDIEFKRKVSTPEKIARTLIALANTKGGHILFGVDDDGSIIGVESEKSEADLIRDAGLHYCDPAIRPAIDYVPFDGRDVIVATVAESGTKPHYYIGELGSNGNGHSTSQPNGSSTNGEHTRVFIRVNDKTVMASKEVVKILQAERADAPPMRLEFGENEKRLLRYLDANERITTKEYCRLVNISEQRAARILVTLVRAGVVRIHTFERRDFFTLAYDVQGM